MKLNHEAYTRVLNALRNEASKLLTHRERIHQAAKGRSMSPEERKLDSELYHEASCLRALADRIENEER
jgi:hypothetical protein